jgi:hypothetical protein
MNRHPRRPGIFLGIFLVLMVVVVVVEALWWTRITRRG